MRTSTVRTNTVTLDMNDAMELSELLDYLAQWLAQADDHVRADLIKFACYQGAMPLARESLISFARLLVLGHAPVTADPDLNWRLSDELEDFKDLDGLNDFDGLDTSW